MKSISSSFSLIFPWIRDEKVYIIHIKEKNLIEFNIKSKLVKKINYL